MSFYLNSITGLIPVLLYLVVLVYLDSYKLIRLIDVAVAILFGCSAAAISYFINRNLISFIPFSPEEYSKYAAPFIEESAKGIFIVFLISNRRIGFLIDAAIYGFAVGAGFGLIENIFYLSFINSNSYVIWIVRGFGTAVMHGGSTALMAIIAKYLSDRLDTMNPVLFIPGFASAVIMHSVFNHFLFSPLLQTALQLIISPFVVLVVLYESEKLLRDWMENGLDSEVSLLEIINEGKTLDSHIGKYLISLKDKFEGPVLADILCLLKLCLELSASLKGILLQREAGLNPKPEKDVHSKFDEIKYLEKNIGKTGRIAMTPLLHIKTKELKRLFLTDSIK